MVFNHGPSKICGRQPLKKLEVKWSRSIPKYLDQNNVAVFKIFKVSSTMDGSP